jgi:hypothetical protein
MADIKESTMKTTINDTQLKGPLPVGKSLGIVALVTALLLMVPLVAMQFTNEVVWTFSDFVVAGILIAGTGLLYVLAAMKLRTTQQRAIAGAVLAVLFLLTWIELAVGIFGSPLAGS